jgi:hypothetical protein
MNESNRVKLAICITHTHYLLARIGGNTRTKSLGIGITWNKPWAVMMCSTVLFTCVVVKRECEHTEKKLSHGPFSFFFYRYTEAVRTSRGEVVEALYLSLM